MKTDRITLQLIGNALAYASEEMGLALRNAAYSPNIKERMDHSAAIFDHRGRLLAQAEHIPVHLGSLPWGLRNMLERCRREGLEMDEGSMVMANNPYVTGTHLNDVTVVAPVHHEGSLVGFVVNKAHHSDVGGKVPGSISPDASNLFEEGAVFDPAPLTSGGAFVTETLRAFCSRSRTPKERVGDLRAQVAANVTGMRRLSEVLSRYGARQFRSACKELFERSSSMTRKRLSLMRYGCYEATETLEGLRGRDLKLRASVTISKRGVVVDYDGTAAQVDYPLNAVFGVTLSGVYFVIRTLTGDDIPANHGAFLPISVSAPTGSLLNPTSPHPVGGGNVETSQRNADLVYRALAGAAPRMVPAASGGSMNNVMVGGTRGCSRWAFYETIGVGLGGRSWMDGLDGIQCNMTNTMNTPIEEIERSLPMMVTRYEFRPHSGGEGEFRGGCGIIRTFRMLSDETTFTVLADRERHPPWGLLGGLPGVTTEILLKRGGRVTRVAVKSTLTLRANDEVELRTAGGGGYGSPKKRPPGKAREDVSNGLLPATAKWRSRAPKSHLKLRSASA